MTHQEDAESMTPEAVEDLLQKTMNHSLNMPYGTYNWPDETVQDVVVYTRLSNSSNPLPSTQ
jgi:TRAP-type uncharacterized transport system substrate-binding protein